MISKTVETQRKRTATEAYSNIDQAKEDKLRQTKIKKIHEAEQDSRNGSIISTDKASEISQAVRQQNQQKIVNRNKVSMTNILKNLAALKNEIKMSVVDNKINEDLNVSAMNNVIHLRQIDSEFTDVSRAIAYIDEYNTRPSKIITNVLKNCSKTTWAFKYAPIEPGVYANRIPLKDSKSVKPIKEPLSSKF